MRTALQTGIGNRIEVMRITGQAVKYNRFLSISLNKKTPAFNVTHATQLRLTASALAGKDSRETPASRNRKPA
jgi:hypothetical protein